MKVIWRVQKRDGSVRTYRKDYATGKIVALGRQARRPHAAEGGQWQLSTSCGVPIKQLARAQEVDHELGCSIDYVKRGPFAYAAFKDAPEKRKWLRKHKWVDHDAGYRDPCPGDFTERNG